MHKNQKDIIRKDIYDEVITNGFIWSSISALLAITCVSIYLYIDTQVAEHSQQLVLAGYASFACGVISFITGEDSVRRRIARIASCTMISFVFVCAAWVVLLNWNEVGSAGKILIVGFLVMIMGWHVEKYMALFSVLPIFAMYIYVLQSCNEEHFIDHIVMGMSLPLIFFTFMFTIHRFYRIVEQRFVETVDTIDKLEKISRIDDLTKTVNRKGFDEGLIKAIMASHRFNIPLSLAIIDIDFFKQYNDSLGHPAGDWCLKKVAGILRRECKRSVDLVARVGGEEFALILPGANLCQSNTTAQNIVSALHDINILHPDSEISSRLTLSIGIAEYDGEECWEDLYKRADKAMYKAKLAGRNRVVADD